MASESQRKTKNCCLKKQQFESSARIFCVYFRAILCNNRRGQNAKSERWHNVCVLNETSKLVVVKMWEVN